MEAASFLKLFEGHPQIDNLIEKSGAPPGEKIHLQGVIGSARSIIAANLHLRTSRNLLVVLPEREEAAYFYDDLVSL